MCRPYPCSPWGRSRHDAGVPGPVGPDDPARVATHRVRRSAALGGAGGRARRRRFPAPWVANHLADLGPGVARGYGFLGVHGLPDGRPAAGPRRNRPGPPVYVIAVSDGIPGPRLDAKAARQAGASKGVVQTQPGAANGFWRPAPRTHEYVRPGLYFRRPKRAPRLGAIGVLSPEGDPNKAPGERTRESGDHFPRAAAPTIIIPTPSHLRPVRPAMHPRLSRRCGIFAAVAVLLVAVPARAQKTPVPPNPAAPVLKPVTPHGAQRGTTIDLTLTGSNLAEPTGLWLDFPAKATFPPENNNGKDGGKLLVRLEVPKDAPMGFHALRLATTRGLSNLRLFCVDDLPQVLAKDDNHALATAQPVAPPCVVVGRTASESNDYYQDHRRGRPAAQFRGAGPSPRQPHRPAADAVRRPHRPRTEGRPQQRRPRPPDRPAADVHLQGGRRLPR